MRVALVSDPLFVYGGAERVIERILTLFPHADVFALVDFLSERDRAFLHNRHVVTSFIQRMPFARGHFRKFLSLWPVAIESLDMSGYDLVISSHHAVAHGVITAPYQLHVSYTHSPMRYAWDLQQQYLDAGRIAGVKRWLALNTLHRARIWDTTASRRVDAFATNSAFVAARVRKLYGRDATVVYPPVAARGLRPQAEKDDYYIAAGRLATYKRFDLIVEAFNQMPGRTLVVAGTGPQERELKAAARANIHFLGHVPEDQKFRLLAGARAFVFAGIEDFGITAVEAQACGTPVVALGKGGLAEIVREIDRREPTGVLFTEQTVDSIRQAVRRFEASEGVFAADACHRNALRFDTTVFDAQFSAFIAEQMDRPTGDFPIAARVLERDPLPAAG